MSHLIESLTGIIIHLISSSSYFGVYILMTLESALIPIPSEITLPFAGFLSTQGRMLFPVIILVGALGDLTGALISYAIGYFLEEEVIVGVIKKYGKIILVTEYDYQKAMSWFKKYGTKIVFFSRLIPGVRTFISVPAGIFEMDIKKFVLYTFSGALIWSAVLTFVGVYFGKNWNSLEPIFRKLEIVIAVLFVLAILFYINHKLKIIKLHK